jgi:hypothetical protein
MALNHCLQKTIYKATGEEFDLEEVDTYLLMALEEFICWEKGLSAYNSLKWFKYKVLQYACCALCINDKENEPLFDKRAKYYRNKTSKLLT